MEELTRRGFVGAAGAAMAIGAMAALTPTDAEAHVTVFGDEVDDETFTPNDNYDMPTEGQAPEEAVALTGWTGTPEDIAALGGSTMPLEELNRRRKIYVDRQTDYTMEDGTYVPAVYMKIFYLTNTYGMGCGETPLDASLLSMMDELPEDLAEAYLDLPWGKRFTAIDFYNTNTGGRTYEECQEICETLADKGWIIGYDTSHGREYHQCPYYQGITEYHFNYVDENPFYAYPTRGVGLSQLKTGTPTFYCIPCDKDVVADSGILPYDDIELVIKNSSSYAIAPCTCRLGDLLRSDVEDVPHLADFQTGELEDYFSELCGDRVETCLQLGEEADYWVQLGIARYISQEDALRYMQRSRDDGFMLQTAFTTDHATVCSCDAKSCAILAQWFALGSPEAAAGAKDFQQISHYNLEVDFDSCIKCGMCAERCPLEAITMDGEYNGETGYPQVNAMCFRCGQCCYICPQNARTLVARPVEENIDLPRDMLDDANMQAAWRFEHDMIW